MSVDLLRCALPGSADPGSADPDLAERIERTFIRSAILDALAAARRSPAWATPTLARWFRKTRRLGSRDRPLVSDAVFGIIRHEHLLVRAGARSDEDLHALWCRLVEGDRFDAIEATTPAQDYATALSLPGSIASEWLERLGPDDAAALARALSARAPVTVRANRLLCTREQLTTRLLAEGIETTPCAQAPDGLHVVGRLPLGRLDSHKEGWFEVQDESSQLLIEAIPIVDGTHVMDLCAGSGGKSLGLAARGARVQAYDIRDDALDKLHTRARRASAPIQIAAPRPAPVVLVDAPCSSTGRLRRDPALRWGLDAVAQLPLQEQLIAEAGDLVLPGGVLVWSTCSLLRAENDHMPPGSWTLESERWLWPHVGGTDGFAWKVWRRG